MYRMAINMKKKLYRSATDKKFSGVCGGIAEYFGIDSTVVRLLFLFAVIFLGMSLWVYIVCALVIPENPVSDVPYKDVNEPPYTNDPYNPNGQ